ncbi:ABC transporter substrate-binding protein [Robbsia sp. Bb-Pol-6]|uniref:Probable sugar-binding periplasmic protein n=1 Tax=Robbsia betulipollinis TaxID=2981849 RepID=A0ABT3ZHB9_9BURK|nr:ABC transporter substrate-binding protein [Robbsia betulipollinis]MCY0385926.1 ABC transporter substrate-binding protein [Robbsia betulipollinis]
MKIRASIVALTTVGLLSGASAAQAAQSLEVLHWWTSGGESKAVGVLKQDMEKEGYQWKDVAVAGGAGANAMTALKTRVISGNAPSAAQIKGPAIQEWAEQDLLQEIDPAAKGWAQVLPPEIDKIIKHDGHYVAAPFSVHRVNWLWVNADLLKKVGAQPPTTWPEFFAVADKIKAAGQVAIAAGGQPWQDLTIWETVVLSQGPAFYKKAIVDLDPKTLNSPQMVQVFDTVRKITTYFDKGYSGRDWNLATAMVINGQAGFQFMGDWAKGEFANANKVAGKDYLCIPAPGTATSFTFNVDSFVFFKQKDPAALKGQLALASTIMTPDFQRQFSLYKGSIPVRLGTDESKFDECARKSIADEKVAIKGGAFVPSLAHGMAQLDATAGAMTDVVTHFMNSTQDSKSAAADLARAAKTK